MKIPSPQPLIAHGTRWLQARFPARPLKGLTRLSTLLNRWLPPYQGAISLESGARMWVDSRVPAERWLLYSGDYQPALTRLLKQHTPRGGCCLDVGANLGFYTIQFGEWVGSAGRVIAFEANPALVERIEQNIALNGFAHVRVVSAAVSNQAGEMAFYISSSPGKSSTQAMDQAVQKLVVPAITLDGYLAEHPLDRLDVIKMDIEGSDCAALIGASDTLTHFRPLIVFEYKPSTPPAIAQETFDLLARLNYELWSLARSGERRRFELHTTTDTDVLCLPLGD